MHGWIDDVFEEEVKGIGYDMGIEEGISDICKVLPMSATTPAQVKSPCAHLAYKHEVADISLTKD
jgi:hypothetical protein